MLCTLYTKTQGLLLQSQVPQKTRPRPPRRPAQDQRHPVQEGAIHLLQDFQVAFQPGFSVGGVELGPSHFSPVQHAPPSHCPPHSPSSLAAHLHVTRSPGTLTASQIKPRLPRSLLPWAPPQHLPKCNLQRHPLHQVTLPTQAHSLTYCPTQQRSAADEQRPTATPHTAASTAPTLAPTIALTIGTSTAPSMVHIAPSCLGFLAQDKRGKMRRRMQGEWKSAMSLGKAGLVVCPAVTPARPPQRSPGKLCQETTDVPSPSKGFKQGVFPA